MKRWMGVIFFVLSALEAAVAQDGAKVLIGVSTPLSGEAATYGTDIKNAVALAVE